MLVPEPAAQRSPGFLDKAAAVTLPHQARPKAGQGPLQDYAIVKADQNPGQFAAGPPKTRSRATQIARTCSKAAQKLAIGRQPNEHPEDSYLPVKGRPLPGRLKAWLSRAHQVVARIWLADSRI